MNKDEIYMSIAFNIAKLSHCVSHKVGVILVKDGRILSTGINGTPKTFKNCDETFDPALFDRAEHHAFSEMFEIHAEINAIIFAAQHGISIKDSVMYTTLHPCNQCLKMICNSGIKKIYYCDDYDLFNEDPRIKDLLDKCGVSLIQVKMPHS